VNTAVFEVLAIVVRESGLRGRDLVLVSLPFVSKRQPRDCTAQSAVSGREHCLNNRGEPQITRHAISFFVVQCGEHSFSWIRLPARPILSVSRGRTIMGSVGRLPY
jgi:hypothetical protein